MKPRRRLYTELLCIALFLCSLPTRVMANDETSIVFNGLEEKTITTGDPIDLLEEVHAYYEEEELPVEVTNVVAENDSEYIFNDEDTIIVSPVDGAKYEVEYSATYNGETAIAKKLFIVEYEESQEEVVPEVNGIGSDTDTNTDIDNDNDVLVEEDTLQSQSDKPDNLESSPSLLNAPLLRNGSPVYGGDYVPGHVNILSNVVEIVDGGTTVDANSSVTLRVTTDYEMNSDEFTGFENATAIYEFRIKTTSTKITPAVLESGTEISFQGIGNSLTNLAYRNETVDGQRYSVVQGKHPLVHAIPGFNSFNFGIGINGGINNEDFTIESRVWLEGDEAPTTWNQNPLNLKISSTLEGKYDLYAFSNYVTPKTASGQFKDKKEGVVISGYYNKTTGAFYTTENKKNEAGDSGAIYGRVVVNFTVLDALISNGTPKVGTERLDPTKDQTWKMDYKVEIDTNGTIAPVEDEYKPIFIDSKIFTNKDINGAIKNKDLTLSGNISALLPDYILYAGKIGAQASWAYNTTPQRLFFNNDLSGEDNDGTVSFSVNAKEDPFRKGYGFIVMNVFFVPCNLNDAENVKRTLTVSVKDLSIVGASGQIGTDSNPDNNVVSYDIPRKKVSSGDGNGITQYFTHRGTGNDNAVTAPVRTQVNLVVPEEVLDSNEIHSFNQLLKVDPDFIDVGEVTANAISGNASYHAIYACKVDKTNWTSRQEMFETKSSDLVYFDTLQAAKEYGKVVGVLFEYRNGLLTNTLFSNSLANGKNTGKSRITVVALDTEIWWGSDKNNTTFYGTNGNKVTNIPEPSFAMYASDGGTYIESTFSNGRMTYQDPNQNKYGYTYHFCGYILFAESEVLNGRDYVLENAYQAQYLPDSFKQRKNRSTYMISSGERVVAGRTVFKIKYAATDGDDPNIDIPLRIGDPYVVNQTNKARRIGKMYIADFDAEVIWNQEDLSFDSEDPSFRELSDEERDNYIFHTGEYAVYYTLYLGDETNLKNEISVGEHQIIQNINYINKSLINFPTVDNYDGVGHAFIVKVVKSASIGTVKTPLDSVVAPEDVIGYRLTSTNAGTTYGNYRLLDVLPFNNDGRGSEFTGSYKLKDNKVILTLSSQNTTVASDFEVWYTTDERVRSAGEDGIPVASEMGDHPDPNSSLGVSWKQITGTVLSNENGLEVKEFSLTDGDVPTAIVLIGTFSADERYSLELDFELVEDTYGDIFSNNATSHADGYNVDTLSATSTIRVVHKYLEGYAFKDLNNDGLWDEENEEALSGIKVALYDEENDAFVSKNVYGVEYGDVATDQNGYYRFDNIPDGSYRVAYLPTEQQLSEYVLSTYHEEHTSHDSKNNFKTFEGTNNNNISATTDKISLSTYREMADANRHEAYQKLDLGLTPIFNITYLKGTKGLFEEEVNNATLYEGVLYGTNTPEYNGEKGNDNNPLGVVGYHFTGWNPELTEKVTDHATYTAQWAPNEDTAYKVEYYYETNGEYNSDPDSFVMKKGTTDTTVSVTDEDKVPTTDNYIFDESMDDDLSGVIEGDGSLVLKVYFKQVFTVTYKDGFDSTVFEDQTYTGLIYNEETPVFEGTPTKHGYVFKGFSPEVKDNVTEDAEYIAQWEKEKFNITYVLDGGNVNGKTDDIVETYEFEQIINIKSAPKKDGYRFTYWKGSVYYPGDEYQVTENHIFIAQWEKIEETKPDSPKPTTVNYSIPKTGVD